MAREYESDEVLAAEITAQEQRVRFYADENSFNSINSPLFQGWTYADTGEAFNLREELRGKVVADVGSGCGALAKSAFLEGFLEETGTTIESINPSFRIQVVREIFDVEFNQQILPVWYPNAGPERLADAARYHDEHSSEDYAHDLHYDPNTFGYVLDVNAMSKYTPKGSAAYGISMWEMLRVLRPGGKMLVIVDRDADSTRATEGAAVEEARLWQLGVQYRLLQKPPVNGKAFFAAVVTKPAK